MLNFDQCWEAVTKRDASQNGRFWFGVVTTGVYCKPSCAARPALRKNVRFYESTAAAEKDGLRPCKRCKPLGNAGENLIAEKMRRLCQYIDAHVDEALTLSQLATEAGMSPFHLQRIFKASLGLTPKQYMDGKRMERLKSELKRSDDVTNAVYGAGYGSASRVYERADTRLGMTPNQYRQGGKDVEISYAMLATPLGPMMLGATDRGLCFLQFGESEERLIEMLKKEYSRASIGPMERPSSPQFEKWVQALNGYLAGTQHRLDLPLDLRATVFQMRVWNYLQTIPYGEVQSYAEVAAGVGNAKATRAVARACAANRVALVVPCHRVIRGTGELGGYRWGMARKRMLIDRERSGKTGSTASPKN